MKKLPLLVVVLCLLSLTVAAQQLYMPRNVKNAFAAGTRSPNGMPGKNYWQNTATYNISITANPPNKQIDGVEEITYTNNSPDTLDRLVFRLTMNTHSPEAAREYPADPEYLTSGVHIDEYKENGKVKEWRGFRGSTWTQVQLNVPLAPHASIKLSFKWHYNLATGQGREGIIDKTSYFLAYFYPRVAVYDDIDGWDTANFTEGHEFYNDFNNYTLQVTAPKNFIVWATGDLQNSDEVLQPEFAARLKQSLTSDSVVRIATANDLAAKKVTAQKDMLTWKWKANNVSDVAVALSDHYLWDGASVVVDKSTGRRASAQSAYNIEAKDFAQMAEFARHALEWTSNNWPGVPYPYSKTTVFRGFADMEYPMMVNDSSNADPAFSKFVVEHEILHTYFPFMMGINEQRYGFMDEGWTTAFENLIVAADTNQQRADAMFKNFRVEGWIKSATADGDIPIITAGDAMTGRGFGNNIYGKPAIAYLAFKDMLGDAMFKKSLHEFMNRWRGKHPLPWDMFNSFNAASGKNYNWFFHNWFFTNGYIDMAVDGFAKTKTGYTLKIKNIGGFAAPTNVIVTYSDGKSETFHQTPAIWAKNQALATVAIPAKKPVKSLVLEGGIWMDADESNNTWAAP